MPFAATGLNAVILHFLGYWLSLIISTIVLVLALWLIISCLSKQYITCMNNYYVCDCAAHKALHGPWTSAAVVQWINSQPNPKLFCNMSNCMLAQAVVNYIDTAMRNSSPTPLRQS
jgi:hypothetical protein